MRILLIILIAIFIYLSSHAYACFRIPDKGVDVSELPAIDEAQESFTISLSAFSMYPTGRPDGSTCNISAELKLYLLTDNPKVIYDGYLVMKVIDGNPPSYVKQRIRNATKIQDNTVSISFIPGVGQWNRTETVNLRFQVQYVSYKGEHSKWSDIYDLNYTAGDAWFLKRFFKPELKPNIHAELTFIANAIVELLFEIEQQNSATEKLERKLDVKSDELGQLWDSLGELAQKYTQFSISNINVSTAYPFYSDFFLASIRFYSASISKGDIPKRKSELLEALRKIEEEWVYCQHIAVERHPRFTNKDRKLCQ